MTEPLPALRADAVVRALRGAVTGSVAWTLGLLAHVAAGGLLPGPGWLVATLLAACGVGAAALGAPARLPGLVALVAGGQFAVHLVLTALAGHGPHPVARPVSPATLVPSYDGPRRGSLYDLTTGAGTERLAAGPPHWVQHVVDDISGPHALMALAHLVAASAVAAWLAVGESALWVLVCLLAVGVLALVRLAVPVAAPSRSLLPASALTRLARPLPPPLLGALARRGPPRVLA
ncbi:hypothetical protein [Nocardioides flavescens]|uniref:Uncharacterized protein n=1 Tax=Nocardioides flavescens TaxID=2691959 RepID=A0A6L7F411_9ACTN|nr:hypothetical protein [Nocardioides flavescens]MXG91977.1 hypothetical protein [Nocardioides flavescens]